MKRVFLMAVMFVSVLTAMSQDKMFESCPLEVIEQGWKSKTIDNVINGSFGIMLDRFNRTWPTWTGDAICQTWKRTNGHKLLAVRLGKPTDPFIDFVCFYDYDPAKKTLTPEPETLKGYRWVDREPYTQLFCRLPRVGKNVVVEDWGKDGPVEHTFTWDGMKFVFSKTQSLIIE